MKHYSSGRSLAGVFIMVLGMVMVIGAVYCSVAMNRPTLNLLLAVSGGLLLLGGFGINHFVVRRRISKRGYFDS